MIQFTSSIPNGDPACPGKNVVLTCQAIGTSIRWDYGNNGTIKLYNTGENCGNDETFNTLNRDFLPPGLEVSTVLASTIEVSEPGHVFNCTAILEINSTVPILQNEIRCVSAVADGTEDTRTFSYTVFMIGKYCLQLIALKNDYS